MNRLRITRPVSSRRIEPSVADAANPLLRVEAGDRQHEDMVRGSPGYEPNELLGRLVGFRL